LATPVPPVLSVAAAVIETVFLTVLPAVGAVMLTVGAVLSTVTVTAVAVVVLPAASRATAVSVWLPLEVVAVFQLIEYGLVLSPPPSLPPSS